MTYARNFQGLAWGRVTGALQIVIKASFVVADLEGCGPSQPRYVKAAIFSDRAPDNTGPLGTRITR